MKETVSRRDLGLGFVAVAAGAVPMIWIPSARANTVAEPKLRSDFLYIRPSRELKDAQAYPEARTAMANTLARHGAQTDAMGRIVLLSNEAYTPIYPASTTKIGTAICAFRALDQDRIELGQEIKIEERDLRRMSNSELASADVDEALKLMLCLSHNDMARALARTISGSSHNFAEEYLNPLARELGMENTHFANPDGWPDEEQYTTAEALSRFVDHMLDTRKDPDGKDRLDYFGIPQLFINREPHYNSNHLLENAVIDEHWKYPGVKGMKTGRIDASGYNIALTAEFSGFTANMVTTGHVNWIQRNDFCTEQLNRAKALCADLQNVMTVPRAAQAKIEPIF